MIYERASWLICKYRSLIVVQSVAAPHDGIMEWGHLPQNIFFVPQVFPRIMTNA